MNNNTGVNNGEQVYVEGDNNETIIFPKEEPDRTKECVHSTEKSGNIAITTIITLVSLLADAITIYLFFKDIESYGFFFVNTFKFRGYLAVFCLFFVVFLFLLYRIIDFIRYKHSGKYVLGKDGYTIYKIIPEKCFICGENCGGKLKIKQNKDTAFFVCNQDSNHKTKVEYNTIQQIIFDSENKQNKK